MRFGSPLLILLLVLVFLAGPAYALRRSVEGTATLGMQSYTGESSGLKQETESTYQQYTVMVSQSDTLFHGRAGAYTLMLGYELNRLNPSSTSNGVRDPDVVDIDTGKVYYNGDLVVAPGGLPFRLALFARDNRRSIFTSDESEVLSIGTESFGAIDHLLAPNIYTDLSNGTNRVMGGTLLLGIRNGSYLGAYRDVLSQLPRLLVDFKQVDVKDLHGSVDSNTHFRDRDLAFVSLNKKDNWVHLRMRDHTDYLQPENDSLVQQVMIGTIDHLMVRRWINLTNWIKISSDISSTVTEEVLTDKVRTYNLNLLLVSNRNAVKTSVLSQFNRQNDGEILSQEAAIPVSLSIDFNRDTRLRSFLVVESKDESLLEGLAGTDDPAVVGDFENAGDYTAFYLDNHLELQRTQRILITPRLQLEARSQGAGTDGVALRASSEVASNGQLNKAFNWLAGYALTVTNTRDEEDGNDMEEEDGIGSGTYLQNEIYGRVDKNLGRALRMGAHSKLAVGSGKGRDTVNFRIATMPVGLNGTDGGDAVDSSYDGMISAGDLTLFIDHQTRRLGNRLELDFSFFMADDVSTAQTTLRHALKYSALRHRLDWDSNLFIGEGHLAAISSDFEYVENNNSASDNTSDVTWDSRLKYHYDPNRSFGLVLGVSTAGARNDANTIAYKISEELFYRIFTSNGVIRKLVELTEELGYETVSDAMSNRGTVSFGRFSVAYFPTRNLFAKLQNETILFHDSSAVQHINIAEVGANFQKLKIMANYSEGNKEEETEFRPEVAEKRWEVKVQKIF